MTCDEALEAILEAEPDALAGLGDHPLADHVRTCTRCRALARSVMADEEALGRELGSAVPASDLEGLLNQAFPPRTAGPKLFRPRHRALGLALIPLAAAAAAVSLFFHFQVPAPGVSTPSLHTPPGLGLVVPEGRNAAVLATNNPDITVLWFF